MTERLVEAAYHQGVRASRPTGLDSLMVSNPYDDHADADLHEAWERGKAEASEPGFVFDKDAMQRAATIDWIEMLVRLSRTVDR